MPFMDIQSEFRSVIKEDKRLSDRLRMRSLQPSLRKVFGVIAHSGDSKFWWPVFILLWLFGGIFWKQWEVTVVIGIGLAAAVQWIVKHAVRRDRPIGLWGRHARRKDPNSFPSGHATRTFLLAVLATALGPAWLAIVLWVWALLVSLARVVLGVHYLSDVIGGLLIGALVALVWLHFHERALAALASLSLHVLRLPLW